LGTNTGGLHITLAISNSFFRENIKVVCFIFRNG
jgi:hypothetical protein